MSEEKVKLTLSQRLAVETMGRNVLVAASAGTGKTSVLARRCANLLADEERAVDVSQMLVLTFTEAAAGEMRSRIGRILLDMYRHRGGCHLRRQLLCLDDAYISTIHSFCRRLITEHFYLLGIDPTFGIIESDERDLLRMECLDRTVREAWDDATLAQSLEVVLKGRNVNDTTGGFFSNIEKLSGFVDSLPDRVGFYDKAVELAGAGIGGGGVVTDKMRDQVLAEIDSIRERIEFAGVCEGHYREDNRWLDLFEENYLPLLERVEGLVKAFEFDKAGEAVGGFEHPRMNAPKSEDKYLKEIIKGPFVRARDAVKKLGGLALFNPRYDEVVGAGVSLQVRTMVELTRRFEGRYEAAKERLNCLDFSDLQHLALRLLDERAEVASDLRGRLRYVFVDEYQDINELQKAIIDRVSGRDNCFVVGDVKQSIYGFREARPELFVSELAGAVPLEIEVGSGEGSDAYDGVADSGRVDLRDNFRSREEVLDFVNAVFSRVMRESVCSVDYDASAQLRAGFEYEDFGAGGGEHTEIYVIDEDDDGYDEGDDGGGGSEVSKAQRQACFIAERIKRMVGVDGGVAEFNVYDRAAGAYRPVRYGDIAILMRARSGSASEYVEVLQLAGVPVVADAGAGRFEATEVTDMICLLKVLDNPRSDIELASVLRGPMFGFTDDELAEVRAGVERCEVSESPFCDRVYGYCENGADADLRGRLEAAVERLGEWRAEARSGLLSELIWRVYRETGLLGFVSAMLNGSARRANLMAVYQRAVQFEGFASSRTGVSLFRFVEFIEKLTGSDKLLLSSEADAGEAGDAVRIMSVHQAKGLEYPVVFLAELGRRFNMRDTQGEVLLDGDVTVGVDVYEGESGGRVASIGQEVIKVLKRREGLAEEMRILYVAMTRAREKLVLTAGAEGGRCRGRLMEYKAAGTGGLRDFHLLEAGNLFDWVLMAVAEYRQVLELFGVDGEVAKDAAGLFSIDRLEPGALDERVSGLLRGRDKASFRELFDVADVGVAGAEAAKKIERLKEVLGFEYPFKDAACRRAKTSVTYLTRGDEFAEFNAVESIRRRGIAAGNKAVGGRSWAAEGGGKDISGGQAARVGTASHMVLETIDLSRKPGRDDVLGQVENLVSESRISAVDAEAVDVDSIVRFFDTEVGERVLEAGANCLREWSFTYCGGSAEPVIQGVVDLLVPVGGDWVLIDFKTDRVDAAGAAERGGRYSGQIGYYREAAEAILGGKVTEAYVYFLLPGVFVGV
jgi:ATP-dependent helicase/nuclease subunit A